MFDTRGIVVCAAALLVIGLGGAIAWDTHRSLADDHAKALRDLKAAQNELRETKIKLRKAEAGQKDWVARGVDLGEKAQAAIEANKKLVNALYARIAELEGQVATSAATTSRPATSQSWQGTALTAKVNIPRWIPEAPAIVERKIKERATKTYGNDFSAARYEIERQTAAHEKLVRYHRMNNPTVNDLLAKSAFEKGDDFQGIVWEVERQLEAAQLIQGR